MEGGEDKCQERATSGQVSSKTATTEGEQSDSERSMRIDTEEVVIVTSETDTSVRHDSGPERRDETEAAHEVQPPPQGEPQLTSDGHQIEPEDPLEAGEEGVMQQEDVVNGVAYVPYESEVQMPDIMRLMRTDLSEPYSIYTYRYFIHNWPKLCILVCVGRGISQYIWYPLKFLSRTCFSGYEQNIVCSYIGKSKGQGQGGTLCSATNLKYIITIQGTGDFMTETCVFVAMTLSCCRAKKHV